MKKTSLAWLNLLHEKARSLIAIAGVSFALILILMQLGFFFAVVRTATSIYDELRFDLLVVSPDYLFLGRAGKFPRQRLFQACSLPEVADAHPLYVSTNVWLNTHLGKRRGILVLGINPQDQVFRLPELQDPAYLGRLNRLDDVFMDTLSHPDFGDRYVGLPTEVGNRAVTVAGQFTLSTGFAADGAILTSDRTWVDLFPGSSLDQVSVGLVTLKPDTDPKVAAARLEQLLPEDVHVYTRSDINWGESYHWVIKTSVGIIFGLGVLVATIVGIGIVYQVLSSDIANRLPEYATLKAMGYSPGYLSRVVLQQALILAIGGFIPALMIAEGLYAFVSWKAHITMVLTLPIALSVLILSLLMCSLSGMLALRKVHSADPADLF
jgi:putative ABC transport system permease protein